MSICTSIAHGQPYTTSRHHAMMQRQHFFRHHCNTRKSMQPLEGFNNETNRLGNYSGSFSPSELVYRILYDERSILKFKTLSAPEGFSTDTILG